MPRLSLPVLALASALPLAAQEAPRVYDLSEVETPPAVRNAAELQAALAAGYPAELAEAGVAGTVVVAFVIGADGVVRDVAVVDAPHDALGAATVEAVRVLRFDPATVRGEAVDVRVTFPVQWQAAPPQAPAKEPAEEGIHPALQKLIDEDPSLAPLARGALELAEVERAPRPRNASAFTRVLAREYPPHLAQSGTGGMVVVRFVVGTDGVPALAHPRSFTQLEFVEPTLRAVRQLRFEPARVGGRPVIAWVDLPVQWTVSLLEGSDSAFPSLPNAGAGYRQPPRSLP